MLQRLRALVALQLLIVVCVDRKNVILGVHVVLQLPNPVCNEQNFIFGCSITGARPNKVELRTSDDVIIISCETSRPENASISFIGVTITAQSEDCRNAQAAQEGGFMPFTVTLASPSINGQYACRFTYTDQGTGTQSMVSAPVKLTVANQSACATGSSASMSEEMVAVAVAVPVVVIILVAIAILVVCLTRKRNIFRGKSTDVLLGQQATHLAARHLGSNLLIVSDDVRQNFDWKISQRACMVMYPYKASSLSDLLALVKSSTPRGASFEAVGFLLTNVGSQLHLTGADHQVVCSKTVRSNAALRNFFVALVKGNINTESSRARIDFLNCTETGNIMTKDLGKLLKIPVYLSPDAYGRNTASYNDGPVTPLYFVEQSLDEAVSYAELQHLDEPCIVFPSKNFGSSSDQVEYSVVLPAN